MIKCPVCGEYEFSDDNFYEICIVCGWELDPIQCAQPDYDGGANELSLNDYRTAWKQKKDKNLVAKVTESQSSDCGSELQQLTPKIEGDKYNGKDDCV